MMLFSFKQQSVYYTSIKSIIINNLANEKFTISSVLRLTECFDFAVYYFSFESFSMNIRNFLKWNCKILSFFCYFFVKFFLIKMVFEKCIFQLCFLKNFPELKMISLFSLRIYSTHKNWEMLHEAWRLKTEFWGEKKVWEIRLNFML